MTLRVAIGPAEIAGTSSALRDGLHELGIDAELALWSPLPGWFPSDRALGRAARTAYAARAPLRRDVLHYQYGRTWLPAFVDARWARLWRRTLAVTYHGDDCRLADVATKLGWPMARFKDPAEDPAVRARLERLGGLCDAAVVADLEVASYVVPFFRRVYVAPVPLHEHDAPPPAAGQRGPVRVLHAPSDELVKGTSIVRAAAAQAAERVRLELVVTSGVPHSEIARELARADLVVDQMFSVSASVFALEAMRAGVPVLTRLDPRGLAPFHASMPIVPVTEETLAGELESLAADAGRRRRLGDEGRSYVARIHAAPQGARAVLRVYEHCRTAPPGVYEVTAERVRALEADILARLDGSE